MKYPKGSFTQHLDTAMKYNDHDMIMDLFADQITDIALKYPDALHAALKNAGVFVTDSKDPKYLVGLVADNWSNKKLLQNISLMIADINIPPTHSAGGDYMNAAVSAPSGNMVGDIVQGVGNIVQGAASITKSAMAPKIEKEKNKGKLFDYLSAKQGAKAEIAKAEGFVKSEFQKHKSTLTYAGIGLAVIAVFAIGIYAYKQSMTTPSA